MYTLRTSSWSCPPSLHILKVRRGRPRVTGLPLQSTFLHIPVIPAVQSRGHRAFGKSLRRGALSICGFYASHVSARASYWGKLPTALLLWNTGSNLPNSEATEAHRTPATTAPAYFPLFPVCSSARAALAPAPPPSSQEPAPRPLPRFSPTTHSGLPFIDATANERSPFLLPARPANRRAPCVIFGSSTSLGYFRCCWLFQGLLARSLRRCFFFRVRSRSGCFRLPDV